MRSAEQGATSTSLAAWLLSPWRTLAAWAPLQTFVPQPSVRMVLPDGSQSLWRGEARHDVGPRALRSAAFCAVVLPPTLHVEYTRSLPTMADGDLERALALDAQASSPFDAADLVWGHRLEADEGTRRVHRMVLTSRTHVTRHLSSMASAVGSGRPFEVWAIDETDRPVVLRGFDEARRYRYAARVRRLAVMLLLLALLLGLGVAVTPTVRLELQVRQARAALSELDAKLGPVLTQRDAVLRQVERIEALRGLLDERVEPLAVVDLLTQAIGDDSWVQRLQVQGGRLTLVGQTPNAAALMNRLSGHPMVRDVRAPGPVTKASGGRENIQIELTLLSQALRPAGVPAEPLASRAPTDPAAPLPAATPPASAAATVPAASAASASAATSASAAASTPGRP